MQYLKTKKIATLEQIKKDYEMQIEALYSDVNTIWDKKTGEIEDSLNEKISIICEILKDEIEKNEIEESIEDYMNSLAH